MRELKLIQGAATLYPCRTVNRGLRMHCTTSHAIALRAPQCCHKSGLRGI